MDRLRRDVPIDPPHAALLLIDVQNYSTHPAGGSFADLDEAQKRARHAYFINLLVTKVLPNQAKLLSACRDAGIEVIYTVIENLTSDGRDRSLDYKISGINVAKGSWDAQVPDLVAPLADEIVFSKTSSSVFISTNIDYVLRNLGVRFLVMVGVLTDQCVDSAVRDACDLGYLVTVVTDACATHTPERHASSLANNQGYCRQVTTEELITEIGQIKRLNEPATPQPCAPRSPTGSGR
jgi:ureidoacrylate peracid hydrolase